MLKDCTLGSGQGTIYSVGYWILCGHVQCKCFTHGTIIFFLSQTLILWYIQIFYIFIYKCIDAYTYRVHIWWYSGFFPGSGLCLGITLGDTQETLCSAKIKPKPAKYKASTILIVLFLWSFVQYLIHHDSCPDLEFGAQGLFMTLFSGITFGRVQETIFKYFKLCWGSNLQGKYVPHYLAGSTWTNLLLLFNTTKRQI